MFWKHIDLHGAISISRVVGEYRFGHTQMMTTGYRIKVFERERDFVAYSNMSFPADDGTEDEVCGRGATEVEALQNAIKQVTSLLAKRPKWEEDDFSWSDPRHF